MKSPKTDELIALICKAATEKYSSGPNGDRVRPGIQIAHIPAARSSAIVVSGGLFGLDPGKDEPAFWYVALHRYPNPTNNSHLLSLMHQAEGAGPSRIIAFKAKHEDLDRAVQLLALQLLPVEAQAELAEAIRGVKP